MIATSNAIAKVAAVAAGLALVASTFAFAVAPIAAQAQTTFSMDLTIGSTGADVTALQNWLIGKGYSIPAGATGYFGAQTQAAVAAFQAANGISPAAGYFGPITRKAVNDMGGSTGGSTGGGSTGGDDFEGDEEGYLDEIDQISSYSTEEVGEGEEDAGVLGVEAEAVDADQMITRVTVEIDTPTGADDLDDLVTDVSLWLDGEELGRMEVDEASHDQSDDEYTFRFTGLEGVISEGETGELVVAVSGVSNLDSGDSGDGWTVAIPADGIRAVSPNGVDDTYGSLIDELFTVESFASANDVELEVSIGDDSPEGQVVNIDASSDTDGVELLQFTIEADGSDLEISEIPVTLTVSGDDDVDGIVNRLTLEIDGEEYAENVVTSATAATITFDDLELEIADGDEVLVTVTADLNDTEGTGTSAFDDGDTVKAEVTASNVDMIEAEDESGEDVSNTDAVGTALGDEMAAYDTGIMVTFVSAEESVVDGGVNGFDGTGTFEIVFDVEAFDGDVYVSDNAVATTATTIPDTTVTSAGVRYYVDGAGTATTDDLSTVVTFEEESGTVTDSGVTNGVKITEGSVGRFTLTATRTNDNTGDAGLYRVLLKAITWATTDNSTQNVYDFNLDDYKTDSVSIN